MASLLQNRLLTRNSRVSDGAVAVNCAEVKGELKRLPVRTVESVSDPNRLAVWQ